MVVGATVRMAEKREILQFQSKSVQNHLLSLDTVENALSVPEVSALHSVFFPDSNSYLLPAIGNDRQIHDRGNYHECIAVSQEMYNRGV